jgi:hypothetical protein
VKTFWWWVLVAGCAAEPAGMVGQFGEEEQLICIAEGRTAAEPGSVVTVGYADSLVEVLVSDVLALVQGTLTETLTWAATGEQTELTVTFAAPGPAEVVVYVPETEGACPTLLELSTDVSVDTADGRLAEGFAGAVTFAGEDANVDGQVSPPEGSIDVVAMSTNALPVEPDVLRFGLRVGADRYSGSVRPLRIGGGDDDATSLANWPVSSGSRAPRG